MVELKRISDPGSEDFRQLMLLYASAFPEEERRDVTALSDLLLNEGRMHFNAVFCDGRLAGLFVYWDFGDFYYLEHLAVYESMRNHKIGAQVLEWTRQHLVGLRILEAEPAVEEMPARRIHYYERNGYTVCDKDYWQPPYRKDGKGIGLWVLCSSRPDRLDEKLSRLKHAVYGI